MRLTTAVEGHATGASQVMLLQTTLLDELLSRDVARCKEDGGGDGLCKQRPGGQPAVVP